MFRLPIALPVLFLCCVTVTPHEATPSPIALAPVLTNFKHSNTVDLGEIFDEALEGPAKAFKAAAARSKDVTLRIDSPGGSIFAGLRWGRQMEDIKKRNGLHVTCIVDGLAASMAAVILESPLCDERLATSRSLLLFHNGSSGAQGTVEELQAAGAFLSAINEAMALNVSKRLGLTVEEYREKIQGADWVLSSRGALGVNALDGLANPEDIAPPLVNL